MVRKLESPEGKDSPKRPNHSKFKFEFIMQNFEIKNFQKKKIIDFFFFKIFIQYILNGC
eukprot:UN23512